MHICTHSHTATYMHICKGMYSQCSLPALPSPATLRHCPFCPADCITRTKIKCKCRARPFFTAKCVEWGEDRLAKGRAADPDALVAIAFSLTHTHANVHAHILRTCTHQHLVHFYFVLLVFSTDIVFLPFFFVFTFVLFIFGAFLCWGWQQSLPACGGRGGGKDRRAERQRCGWAAAADGRLDVVYRQIDRQTNAA